MTEHSNVQSATADAMNPVLELQGLTKTFGGVHALDNADLDLQEGDVLGLIGHNGSGKSTLIKILAGYHQPDGGKLRIHGNDIDLPIASDDLRSFGIGFVHQDLGLVPNLTVLENFLVGNLATGRSWRIDWKAEAKKAQETFALYSLQLDPNALVATLTRVERALLAVVRAVEDARRSVGEERGQKEIIVLDEVTTYLPRDEIHILFGLIRRICANGGSVIFVSHDIDEVLDITTRVTVLRDGKIAGSLETNATTRDELIEMIVGSHLKSISPLTHNDMSSAPTVLEVEQLGGETTSDVSFTLRSGEILGITGLLGSGFEEIPYLLFGAADMATGSIRCLDQEVDVKTLSPKDAIARGLALVPGERSISGVGGLSVGENISLQVQTDYSRFGTLNFQRLNNDGLEWLRRYAVRPTGLKRLLSTLSGGNQQKVILAKWVRTSPSVLLLHEPTQGVDVGARQEIFQHLRSEAERGVGVICASADAEQLTAICDRVLVMSFGCISTELSGSDITKESISRASLDTAPGSQP